MEQVATAGSERRLLVVCESLGIGGAETDLIQLLPRLVDRGWSVKVYCLSERGCRAEQVERSGIQVVSSSRLTGRGRNPLHIGLAAYRLFVLMRRWRPHIAHFYLPGPYLVGVPVAMAAGSSIKIMSRLSQAHYQQHRPLAARVEWLLHQYLDAVIGNSRAVVKDLVTEGIPSEKIRLIYNGVETSIARPNRAGARRTLGIEQDSLIGVMVANLIPYKGHKDLIEGLALVAQSLPLGWRILFAGRDEGIQWNLESLVKERGLTPNIEFLGERTDVPMLLAAADFSVLSSWEEGFSNAILESMAAGLPMIVTDVGGNPEAVLDGETGLIVPPRTPSALGQAVLRLAKNEDLRSRLGAAALLRVREKFSSQSCMVAHESVYEELLTGRAAKPPVQNEVAADC
jgi:glycosyltransferase involved in cell wall biosynthesis